MNSLNGILHLRKFRLIIFLSLLTILAFYLRFFNISSNLFFGPEQGRDFLVVNEIIDSHKITLIGPKTDIDGIFHGPVFYYMATIPSLISRGDPVVISGFFILIQSLSVILIYFLGLQLFSKRIGVISAIFFAVSFESIVYSRWLSNPPLSIPFSILFFLFFDRFLKGDKKSLIYSTVFFSLSGQVEFLNYIFLAGILIILGIIYYKKILKTPKSYLLISLLTLTILSVGNYILFDLRHQFLISKSIISLLVGNSTSHTSLIMQAKDVLFTLILIQARTIVPIFFYASAVILFLGLILLPKSRPKNLESIKIIFIWLFVPLLLLIFLRRGVLDQFFVILIPVFILITAVVIDTLWQKAKFVAIFSIVAVVFINLLAWSTFIPTNKNVFFQSPQPDMKYKDQLAAINWIYNNAGENKFSIEAFTIPYFMPQAWDYLFWYNSSTRRLQLPESNAKLTYLIIQKESELNKFKQDWYLDKTKNMGDIEASNDFGVIHVERRTEK